MSYTSTEHQLQHLDDPPPDQLTVANGAWFEVCCGALGFAVGILGLLGTSPSLMGAIATVVLGFGVFAQAGTIAARNELSSERNELVAIATDLVAGPAGITLGLVALLGIVPVTWVPIATMLLGAGLVSAARIGIGSELDATKAPETMWAQLAMMACGLAAIALALVALASDAPMTTLSLVAIACVGGGLVIAGGGTPTNVRRARHS